MIPPPSSNEQAFFEVAATLIPLLLLGGVLTERLRPSRSLSSGVRLWVYAAIVLLGTLVIWAEVAAISALIEGSSSNLQRVLVAVVLVLGMVLVIGAVIAPWLQRSANRTFEFGLLAALGAVTTVFITILLVNAVDSAETSRRTDAAVNRLTAIRIEQDAVFRRLVARMNREDRQEEPFFQRIAQIRKYPPQLQVPALKELFRPDPTDKLRFRLDNYDLIRLDQLEGEARVIVDGLGGETQLPPQVPRSPTPSG